MVGVAKPMEGLCLASKLSWFFPPKQQSLCILKDFPWGPLFSKFLQKLNHWPHLAPIQSASTFSPCPLVSYPPTQLSGSFMGIWVWDSQMNLGLAIFKASGSIPFFLGFILSYLGMNQKRVLKAGVSLKVVLFFQVFLSRRWDKVGLGLEEKGRQSSVKRKK